MTQKTLAVTVTHAFKLPAERVFDAWLDIKLARKWFFATDGGDMVVAELDPRVGGGFRFTDNRDGQEVEHVGEYLEITRPTRIVFSFCLPAFNPKPDIVMVEISPTAEGCILTLTHTMAAEYEEYTDRTQEGWTKMLQRLATFL